MFALLIAPSSSFATPPLVQHGPRLTGGGEVGEGFFGNSAALSGNGAYAVITGQADEPEPESGSGAAWFYARSKGEWTQQGSKLKGTGVAEDAQFGRSAAISANGTEAVVGGFDGVGGSGAVWTFTRSGSSWTQLGEKLVASEPFKGEGEGGIGNFGNNVALSADGKTLLVGATLGHRLKKTEPFEVFDAALVYKRSGSSWVQQGPRLIGSGELADGDEGFRVALSGDGDTALLGDFAANEEAGAAWVFARSGETWSQVGGELTGEETIGSGHFGSSVALSNDGSTALIGGNGDDVFAGAAWVFTRAGEAYEEQGPKLTGGEELESEEGLGGSFGSAVSLSKDGNTALIGGSGDHENKGAAWVFTRSGSTWAQQGSKFGPRHEHGNSQFGTAVSLSEDAKIALITGPHDSEVAGSAWIFVTPTPIVTSVSPSEGPRMGGTTVTITGHRLGEATAVDFGTTAASSFTVVSPTEITTVSPPGAAGTVDVTVTTPNGTSAVSAKDHFTYGP